MKKESKDTDSLISEKGSILHYIKMNAKSKQIFGRKKPRLKRNKSVDRYSFPIPENSDSSSSI